ncbi:MAG: dTDP-glucose 4,6-dehydratase [Clostridia bacterium]|nr:dTDP-glucose 4,6-dehydratase [Clostridia bacterium]
MKLLVTGGAGFIGSNFILYMLDRYPCDRIVCLDKLTYAGNLFYLERVKSDPRFSFVKGDICHRDSVYTLFEKEGFDIVVNFAAQSHVDRSIASAEDFIQTNVYGVSVLLDACLKYGVTRFHQISTDEVYGQSLTDTPFTEASPLNPSNPYAASKAAADMLAMSYYKTHGINVTVTRSTNNYGPFQHTEKLIPRLLTNAYLGKDLPLYGDGSNIRDWLYITDHCAAVDAVVRKGKAGEIYNVCARNERTNLEIARLVCKTAGINEEKIVFIPDRKGHDKRYFVSDQKLRTQLGWSNTTDFETGFSVTAEWYKKQNI